MKSLLTLSLALLLTTAAFPQLGIATEGRHHPDFLLNDLEGKPGRLSDYRGKPILLFHFASW